MIRYPIVAGAMLAMVSLPVAAQETPELKTGAIVQEGLPEIGVTVSGAHLPGAAQDLVNHSVAAQQYGNLAATKGTESLVGDLGDVMILLHSQINDRLESEGQIAEGDRKRLDELADFNEAEFALGFAGWITDTYPEAIENWRSAPREGQFGELADAVVEQMEGQLQVAEKIIEADGKLTSPDQQVKQTLSWGGAQDQGKTAQQFHLDPRGDTAADDKPGE